MTKITPSVDIEDFRLELMQDRILAMVVIDDAEECTIFSINQTDFEIFVDSNDLREDYYDFDREDCSIEWIDVYQERNLLSKFLKLYIEFLYEQEALKINL